MCKMIDQYSDKIKGTFSFFDRMIINGYLNPLMNEHSRPGALAQLGVLHKNYKDYFMQVTNSIIRQIEDGATELERPVIYLSSTKQKKEDVAKIVLMPGDPLRAKYIAENFLENAKLINTIRNIFGYTGTYKGKKITIFASRNGNAKYWNLLL